jgi:hypothetical protein
MNNLIICQYAESLELIQCSFLATGARLFLTVASDEPIVQEYNKNFYAQEILFSLDDLDN